MRKLLTCLLVLFAGTALAQEDRTLYYAVRTGADTWTIEEIGPGGFYISLALDANDRPHIGYGSSHESYQNTLLYSTNSGSGWNTETVFTNPANGTGNGASLALDSSGRPRIAFYDQTLGPDDPPIMVRYAAYDGSSWSVEAIAEGSGPALAITSGGESVVAYVTDVPSYSLMYATRSSGTWPSETVQASPPTSTLSVSMALTSTNDPAIAFQSGGEYRIATKDGTWSIATITEGSFSGHSQLKLTSDDRPVFAFQLGSLSSLGAGAYVAEWTGSEWDIQQIETGQIGHVTLALDANDVPHVSFYNWSDEDLRYATPDGMGGWTIETIAHLPDNPSIFPSIAIDSLGRPHVAYDPPSQVPEPQAIVMLAIGGGLIGWRRYVAKRKRDTNA